MKTFVFHLIIALLSSALSVIYIRTHLKIHRRKLTPRNLRTIVIMLILSFVPVLNIGIAMHYTWLIFAGMVRIAGVKSRESVNTSTRDKFLATMNRILGLKDDLNSH
jgi:hypothetical protein